jgi:hypothetical protein
MELELTQSAFEASLLAPGRCPEMGDEEDINGFLVGAWELDVLHYRTDVRHLGIKADVQAAWILGGRAVQDTWIARPHPSFGNGVPRMLGTTLRIWAPSIQAWRITWRDVLSGRCDDMIRRRAGRDVVQIGTRADGSPTRWIFTEISDNSFHWTGEALSADGRTWNKEGEFLARRLR